MVAQAGTKSEPAKRALSSLIVTDLDNSERTGDIHSYAWNYGGSPGAAIAARSALGASPLNTAGLSGARNAWSRRSASR